MDHDWAPIAPPEDNGIMCSACLQCQCCETPSEECPGPWVPIPENDEETRDFLDEWGGVGKNQ